MDLLVMENLLFGRNITRLYDLKGSSRSRYNADSNGSNKVLLDQNLIEAMPTSPIFVGNKAKRLLERAVWNDTSFLAVSLHQFILLIKAYRKCSGFQSYLQLLLLFNNLQPDFLDQNLASY
jgi:1-phosphatidylinositol-3-phosphate 5-kinase